MLEWMYAHLTHGPTMQKLIPALIRAKANFAPILKDMENPQFRGKRFASTPAIFAAIDSALADEGLTVTQPTEIIDGKPVLITQLWHESGECLYGTYPLPSVRNVSEKTTSTVTQVENDRGERVPMTVDTKTTSDGNDDPQKLAAGLSWARRNALLSLLGLTAEEEEGDKGSSRPPTTTQRPSSRPSSKPAPRPAKPSQAPQSMLTNRDRFIQLRTLTGHTAEQVKAMSAAAGLPASANSFQPSQCSQLRDLLLIDWAASQQRFKDRSWAETALITMLHEYDDEPTDSALWERWRSHVMGLPLLATA